MAFASTQFGRFFYFQPDAIGQRIASGEFHDRHLKPYLDSLHSGDTFVDVGANIGFLTVYVASRGARVEAFEPAVEVASLLERNVAENNLAGLTTVHRVALYDEEVSLRVNPEWTDYRKRADGGIDWELSPNSGGLSLVRGAGCYKSRTLDSFKFEKMTLLKVDTQGADLRVLVGAKETIKRTRPVICFEFEPSCSGRNASGDSLDDFFVFLNEFGYDVSKIASGMTAEDFVAVPK